MLTQEQMEAAHFARQVDRDRSLAHLRGDDRAEAWAEEMGADVGRTKATYRLGTEVLRGWTLSYGPRFVRGTAEPPLPSDVIALIVDAGHIANAEAARQARFHPRRG